MKRILVRHEICSGCRACEVACVAHHDGRFGTATARIHITKIEPLGLDHPHVCHQCLRAPCIAACTSGALLRDEATGAILIQVDDCIGCSECVVACPFGVASTHQETGIALICDLCAGKPACVDRCATGAIVYTDPAHKRRERRENQALKARERQRAKVKRSSDG
jgi:Fe-S-cluster-containing hydrogenase component 2